jgi:predicted NBD/HSP70 family sugar kinase
LERRNTNLDAGGKGGLGQRSETVRRSNLSAIVRVLHVDGPLSRSELVARTGLTRSAIRDLVGELAVKDLVVEQPAAGLGTPGRPSPLVQLQAGGAAVLSLEIAVDSLAVAVVGLGGAVLGCARVDRPRGHSSPDEVVANLVDLTRRALQQLAVANRLIGVGVAVVGVVRRSDGYVWMAPNLGWVELPLGELLADALNLSVPIAVANEADLGALAELRRGAARGVDNVLFINGEVGVGGGLIVNGEPMTGIAGYGGEVGHMPVNINGIACRCGSVGCWETEIGEEALLTRAGYPRDAGRAGVDLVLQKASEASVGELAAVEHIGRWLGFGLAGLVNVLNPRLVVLGGHFGRLFPFVEPTVRDELGRRGLAAPRALVQILPAVLGVDAPLLGGAELAFEPLLADPGGSLVGQSFAGDRTNGGVNTFSVQRRGGGVNSRRQLVGER